MKAKIIGLLVSLAGLSLAAAEPRYVIPEGGTHFVGLNGLGFQNANSTANITVFEGSGTLFCTNDPPSYTQCNIWGSFYATNATLTVDCSTIAYAPSFYRNLICSGNGKLVCGARIGGTYAISAGYSDAYYLFDVPNMEFRDPQGAIKTGTIAFGGSCVMVKGFPRENVTFGGGNNVIMAGPDLPFVLNNDFSKLKSTRILDPSYLKADASVNVGANPWFLLTKRTYTTSLGAAVALDDPTAWGDESHDFNLTTGNLAIETTDDVSFTGRIASSGGTITLMGQKADAASGPLTFTFASLSGDVRFETTSSVSPKVVLTAVADGARIFVARNIAIEWNDARPPVVSPASGGTWYVCPSVHGDYDLTGCETESLTNCVVVPADAHYQDLSRLGTVKLSPGAGTTMSVDLDLDHAPAFVGGEGTLKLSENPCARAYLWIDPSDDRTIYKLGTATPNWVRARVTREVALTTTYGGNDLVEAVADKRWFQSARYLRHTRHYDALMGTGTAFENLPQVFPYRVKNGPNGLAYLSMGTSTRRIPTHEGTLDLADPGRPTTKTYTGTTFVVMVFGSQNGGGQALIGLGDGALNRGAKTLAAPLAPTPFDIWLDGRKVADVSQPNLLSGGWQIVSIDVTGHNVNGIGWAYDHNTAGGQNYGEVLVFTNALTTAERVNVETYLAKKWGLESQYVRDPSVQIEPARASLYGTAGTVEVEGHVRLSGRYAGSLVVGENATLAVTAPSVPEIPAEGLLGHFDPDDNTTLHLDRDGAVFGLFPVGKTEETMAVDDLFFYGVGSRRPFTSMFESDFAPRRRWIDFNHPATFAAGQDDGNTLRFKAWNENGLDWEDYKSGTTDRSLQVRTVVAALNSQYGGGDPFRSGVATPGPFGTRDKGSWTKPIWSGAQAAVTQGRTRLNGTDVDGTKTGFTGGPEVLSLVTTEPVKLGNLAYYGNTQSQKGSDGKYAQVSGFGEVVGELLFYSTELDEATLKTLEDYLLFKWVGLAPEGTGDFTAATVSGCGTVVAPIWSDLPKFDPSFSGAISVANETEMALTMKVDTPAKTVTGAFLLPEATLNGISRATVNLEIDGDAIGDYPLVSVKACSPAIAWTMNTNRTSNKFRLDVNADGSSVVLKIRAVGTCILFR